MSGTKHATITLSEAEYRRLHEADMAMRFSHTASKADSDHNDNKVLQAAFRALEERQQAFQDYIGVLENEIGQMEVETAQSLMDQQEDFKQELSQREEESAATLDEIARDLSAQIATRERQHVRLLIGMQRRLEMLEGQTGHKTALAGEWLSVTSALRNFIEDHYDHSRFLPGCFEQTDLQMQLAFENLQDGLPEATLAAAQQVYVEYSRVRLELERLTREWQLLFQATLGAVEDLLATLQANKFIPALDEKGNELPIQIQLGLWSEHRFSSLTHHVKVLLSRLRTDPHSFTNTELADLLKNVIPGFKQEFGTFVYEARMAVIYSQIRINIADIAIQALEHQGFVVTSYGFEKNDMRQPYLISFQNIEGSQVVIRVNPIHNAEASNDLVVESHDATPRTESELYSRSQEILRSLARYGLQVGPLRTEEPELQRSALIPERLPKLLQQEARRD